ncbi:sulfite exporter TauE/SafE family protein [Reinekea sp. G2M2-21]|uniref:sulfite exporter TauE/SafE family protein n=1 Tax=Reinekea sp. G2M2-21 TaxID=2788942 RepID=UPI0018AB4B06|nr:sulfite exporter TauE/SafE family protein [Reinekea sp. G2M2-21]
MTDYLAAFLLGLVSSGHCMGMCGGLMLAAGLNASKPIIAIGYNIGRLGTYMTLGISFGALAGLLPEQFLPVLKILSASLLLLTALYLLELSTIVNRIEIIGKPLWSLAQKPARRLLPVNKLSTSIALGFLWGLIPCGLVYTALAFSLSQTSATSAAVSMFSFGLGTFPSMLGASLLASRVRPWLINPWFKKTFALMLAVFAMVTLIPLTN